MARRDDLKRDLKRVFQELAPTERRCVILHHQGHSVQKIAVALDLSAGQVYQQIRRGHLRLHRLLNDNPRYRALLSDEAF